MRSFANCYNIYADGDEYTTGVFGLDWFPSKTSSALKDRYETEITTALTRLGNTWTGWAVINEIYYRSHQKMMIRPYHPNPLTGKFNATAVPTNWEAATLKDTAVRDGHGNLPPLGQPRITGTGIGSDTEIRYSASTWADPTAPSGAGASADEILLHEMIHGLRQMQGRFVMEAISVNLRMDNYEEFAAITISNVYRSEKKFPQLRSDHQDFAPLTGPTATLANFKLTYRQWLSDMFVEQPRLCQNLSQVKCAFNPFVV